MLDFRYEANCIIVCNFVHGCIFILDEFKILVSGKAKASVEKFLEDDHTFEDYTNVRSPANLIFLCRICVT